MASGSRAPCNNTTTANINGKSKTNQVGPYNTVNNYTIISNSLIETDDKEIQELHKKMQELRIAHQRHESIIQRHGSTISQHESTISQHESTISQHESTIQELKRENNSLKHDLRLFKSGNSSRVKELSAVFEERSKGVSTKLFLATQQMVKEQAASHTQSHTNLFEINKAYQA